jgi:hypothetical protein
MVWSRRDWPAEVERRAWEREAKMPKTPLARTATSPIEARTMGEA